MIARIIPFFVIALALGIFFGYVSPTYSGTIAALNKDIKNYDSALLASKEFAKKQDALLAARNAIPPESLQRLEAYLPDGVDNVQLILDLDALAARSGVQLSNFNTTDESSSASGTSAAPTDATVTLNGIGDAASKDSLLLSVTVTGTYNAFRTFLNGIEQSLRPLDVVSLTVTDSKTGVYTYQLSLRIYWLH